MSNYSTKANAASLSGLSSTDISDDQQNSADKYIEMILGRNFGVENSHTHYLDIYGDEKTLQLPHWPIIAITTFRDNQRESSYEDLVEDTDFSVDKQAGLIKLIYDEYNVLKGSASLTVGEKTVKIIYTWGYATTPSDISMFADWYLAWIAEIKYDASAGKNSSGATLARIQVGDYSEAYDVRNDKINNKYKNILAGMTEKLVGKYRIEVDAGDESYHIHFFNNN